MELVSNTAVAKKGGGKGGGNDRGGRDRGGRDRDDRGRQSERSVGSGNGGGGGGRNGDNRSLSEVFEDFRNGKAFGKESKDSRIDRAKDRYDRKQKQEGHRPSNDIASDPDAARVAHRFSAKQADELIGRGWKTDRSVDGFANHGDRVRTMVELAKALGYSASVGALQANFGTPSENGIAELRDELAAARTEAETNPDAAAKVEELKAELASAIEGAKPGEGPDGDWATANLDVNDDGVVDRDDLAALGDRQKGDTEGEVAEVDGETENDEMIIEALSN